MKEHGVSLLEMMMATVLLTVGMVAVMQAFGSGLFADTNVENNTIALHLAQEKVEELRGSAFASVVNESRASNEAALGTFGTVFDRQVIVSNLAPDLKQVDIYVYWVPRGQEVNVRLVTYRVDPS
jgi:Tfp pilus assembly protein PilV